MPKPRRSFAAPLILTVAAVPACVVATKPTNTPGPEAKQPEQRDHRDKGHENPPGPHENPPAPNVNEYDQSWQVRLADDGSCLAYGEVSCEPGMSCNPPRPRPVVCPEGIAAGESYSLWANAGEIGCFTSPPTSCPANATCNPPPPQAIDCPQ